MNLENLAQEQLKLAQQVEIPQDAQEGYQIQIGDTWIALDVQYKGEKAFVAGVLQNYGESEYQIFVSELETEIPYIPQYFSFREGPVLLTFLEKLQQENNMKIDLAIIDGHGVAHPRRLGIASWLGVKMELSTIGVAKETLLTYEGELEEELGSYLTVKLKQEIVGYALRTVEKVKPIFISAGHQIHLETVKDLVLKLEGEYRLPDMLRFADQAARAFAKGEQKANFIIL